MSRTYFMKLAAASVASVGLIAPQSFLHAAQPAAAKEVQPAAVAVDVALANGGLLRGQVVDAQGAPLKSAPVSVWHENQQVAQTTSDANGQFSVTGLRGGVHQVVGAQGYGVYRLWTAQTAPPAAKQGATIISGEGVVRGQNGNVVGGIVRSPVLWGALGYAAGHVVGFNQGLDRAPSSP